MHAFHLNDNGNVDSDFHSSCNNPHLSMQTNRPTKDIKKKKSWVILHIAYSRDSYTFLIWLIKSTSINFAEGKKKHVQNWLHHVMRRGWKWRTITSAEEKKPHINWIYMSNTLLSTSTSPTWEKRMRFTWRNYFKFDRIIRTDEFMIIFSLEYKFQHASANSVWTLFCTNLKLEINYKHLYGFCDGGKMTWLPFKWRI